MLEFNEIKFEDFITYEMREKQKALLLAKHKEMVARNNLIANEYKTSKIVDGDYTEQEVLEIKAIRTQWRKEVNEYSAEYERLKPEVEALWEIARQRYNEAVELQNKSLGLEF
jgi:hypothetical protein